MDFFGLLIIFIPVVVGVAAWLISRTAYRKMVQSNTSRWPKTAAVLIFLFSFAVMFVTIAYIILSNIKFER